MKSRSVRCYKIGWQIQAINVHGRTYELAESGHPKDPVLNSRSKHRRSFLPPPSRPAPADARISWEDCELPPPNSQMGIIPGDISEDNELTRIFGLANEVSEDASWGVWPTEINHFS
jgi:hypothetical protein